MKILHFAPFLQAGGASQLAVDLAYALQAHEVKSMLLSPVCELISPLVSTQLRHFNYRPYPLPGDMGSVLKLHRIISEQKPDIVQAYGYEAVAIAVRACKKMPAGKCPRIVAALTGYPTEQEQQSIQRLSACAATTVVSKHLRVTLTKLMPTLEKLWVIPYGVNETLCHPGYAPTEEAREQWRRMHPELIGRFVVCLPGPISAIHGTASIVPIMAALLSQDIPVHTLIAGHTGEADPTYLSNLRRQLRASGLDSHVTWLGASADMRDVLCLSDVVLSLHQSPAAYDRPILEALSLGRPVAGYDHGAISEYLEAFNPVGALPEGDEDAAADVLSQWHSYPPDLDEAVPYPYRLSDTAANYYELYTNLLES